MNLSEDKQVFCEETTSQNIEKNQDSSYSKILGLENIIFPLKSFTSEKTIYKLSIDIHRDKKKFIVIHCNCGLQFGRSYRISCKHIDQISKMSFNKLIKTYEKNLNQKLTHQIIDDNQNKLYIPIKSSTSNEEYKIFVNEKFKLTCNCGVKFGLNLRTKCKHIDRISNLSFIEIQGLLINKDTDNINKLLNTLSI